MQVAPASEHPDRRCPLFLYPWVLPWFICLFSGNAAFISRGMAASTLFVFSFQYFQIFFLSDLFWAEICVLDVAFVLNEVVRG